MQGKHYRLAPLVSQQKLHQPQPRRGHNALRDIVTIELFAKGGPSLPNGSLFQVQNLRSHTRAFPQCRPTEYLQLKIRENDITARDVLAIAFQKAHQFSPKFARKQNRDLFLALNNVSPTFNPKLPGNIRYCVQAVGI
jgi:hypothetical protein